MNTYTYEAHTPGPWFWCGLGNSQDDLISGGTLGLVSPDGTCICDPPPIGEIEDQGRATFLANAHLIAAAPDLLAALRRYVGKFGNCGNAYEQAIAAIDKATKGNL